MRIAAAISRAFPAPFDVLERRLGAGTAVLVQFLKLFIGKVLDRSEFILCALHSEHEFRQFELDRQRVPVLRILNQEYHKESDDCGAGVDHQLPSIAVIKEWSCNDPCDDHCEREEKRDGMTSPQGSRVGEFREFLRCERRIVSR